MPIISPGRARHRTLVAVALLAAATALTACGERRTDTTANAARPPVAPADTAGPAETTPYVDPGIADGAPHNRDNLAYRRAREISPASTADAKREADRIEPVLKRLWEQGSWTPEAVRAAMLGLGYQLEQTGPTGEILGGTLDVRPMDSRFETDHYVTPPGARIGLRVHPDTCVSASVEPASYSVSVNGTYPETGCFQPPYGH
ncbi:hypothetical protein ACIBCA_17465 [Kitasatospora sp. NPDC051170]|uniref:hypothetical protein n=1 Tax=Kitasatospora sp. NPDC051170 TaxID=3364056 RepID=UPI0037944038